MSRNIFAEQGEALARRQAVLESLDKEFYKPKEAARRLKRSDEAVYAMIEAGEIDVVEVGSGSKREKRIPKAELARALVPAPFDWIRQFLRRPPE